MKTDHIFQYLEDYKDITTNSLDASILQLIVTKPQAAVEKARSLIERVKVDSSSNLSQSQILGLVETIVIYKFPKLKREVIAKMLGLDVLKETRVYKDALQEGKQELILKLLTQRLGQLSAATTSKIEELSDQRREKLSDRLFDIETIDDLRQTLFELTSEKSSAQLEPDSPIITRPTDSNS